MAFLSQKNAKIGNKTSNKSPILNFRHAFIEISKFYNFVNLHFFDLTDLKWVKIVIFDYFVLKNGWLILKFLEEIFSFWL